MNSGNILKFLFKVNSVVKERKRVGTRGKEGM